MRPRLVTLHTWDVVNSVKLCQETDDPKDGYTIKVELFECDEYNITHTWTPDFNEALRRYCYFLKIHFGIDLTIKSLQG